MIPAAGYDWSSRSWRYLMACAWLASLAPAAAPRTCAAAPPISGDFDGDGDVDGDDFLFFQSCLSGCGVPHPPGCEPADFDGDGDVDQSDFGRFQRCLSGPYVPADPACRLPGPIPPRPPGAMTGSAFVAEVAGLTFAQREQRILEEITRGNMPEFLRSFKPVSVASTSGGAAHSGTFEVMPDYLGIGSDADWVRMPMSPMIAQQIADRFECQLPTRKMVNDIWTQAPVKLAPHPLTQDRELVTTFHQHHQIIEQHRGGGPAGPLVAGTKKDVVVTNQLIGKPDRVAIYGWHQLNGQPIQPLYTGHVNTYVDYSHGIRLARRVMTVNGAPTAIPEVLASPVLAPLLSDEGTIANPRY